MHDRQAPVVNYFKSEIDHINLDYRYADTQLKGLAQCESDFL